MGLSSEAEALSRSPGGLAGPWGPPEALTRLPLSLGMGASPRTPDHRQEQTARPEPLPDSPECPLVHREPRDLGWPCPLRRRRN